MTVGRWIHWEWFSRFVPFEGFCQGCTWRKWKLNCLIIVHSFEALCFQLRLGIKLMAVLLIEWNNGFVASYNGHWAVIWTPFWTPYERQWMVDLVSRFLVNSCPSKISNALPCLLSLTKDKICQLVFIVLVLCV